MNYRKIQIEKATKNHDFKYNIKIKFFGLKNNSNFLDISLKELNQIKKILIK